MPFEYGHFFSDVHGTMYNTRRFACFCTCLIESDLSSDGIGHQYRNIGKCFIDAVSSSAGNSEAKRIASFSFALFSILFFFAVCQR